MFHPDQEPKILGTPGVLYPPAFPIPCPQARKGGRQIEKTHNTEGLGSENISMFFSNSIANRKGFLPRPALFRGWTQGASREAGSWQEDAIRELSGRIDLSRMGSAYTSEASPSTGVLQIEKDALPGLLTSNSASEFWMWGKASFSASRVAPTAEENRPVNISVPSILYLGLPA